MKEGWRSDNRLEHISPDKLMFLQSLIDKSQTLKENEQLPFLLALAQKAKKNQIHFSSEEMSLIVSILKEYATDAEILRMDQILKMSSLF
ncbi:MAG: hypothetical protein GX567_16075 [Clostridia bacterium]|nr:hypothetical protein [Clostridia bacterium]